MQSGQQEGQQISLTLQPHSLMVEHLALNQLVGVRSSLGLPNSRLAKW